VVIARTPLRVSFVGGGSDLVSFSREHGGAVISTAIDKYVYVVVTERFEDDIRVSYSNTEIVDRIDDLKHELVREALRMAGLPRKVEVVTIADVPARGTGLGSSSAVTVGALNALFAYQGIMKSSRDLAEMASEIEIDILQKPIGRQDQYASAFGGLNLIRFGPGDTVTREPVIMSADTHKTLERNLLMFFTGTQRSTDPILEKIGAAAASESATIDRLCKLRDLALELHEAFGTGDPDVLGEFLDRGWTLKRDLDGVTTPEIDRWYETARSAGATGGKLLGAGGGGFLLLYVPRAKQGAVRRALAELRELPVRLEYHGSVITHIAR
jgi:D-glycero-alpha-D-manno-heptose-7-phosphate kinase